MSEWVLGRSYASSHGTVHWDRLGAGEPVVLLHGTPFSSFVWRDVARALAHRHQVFVWDMPGYGASEKADGQDVSLAAQARVFAELLEHWGLQRSAAALAARRRPPGAGERPRTAHRRTRRLPHRWLTLTPRVEVIPARFLSAGPSVRTR
jgi:hypothetical protein